MASNASSNTIALIVLCGDRFGLVCGQRRYYNLTELVCFVTIFLHFTSDIEVFVLFSKKLHEGGGLVYGDWGDWGERKKMGGVGGLGRPGKLDTVQNYLPWSKKNNASCTVLSMPSVCSRTVNAYVGPSTVHYASLLINTTCNTVHRHTSRGN
jgi:hypothetical protein